MPGSDLPRRHAPSHELGGLDEVRLSVQAAGVQLNRQRTINFGTGLTAVENQAQQRIDVTAAATAARSTLGMQCDTTVAGASTVYAPLWGAGLFAGETSVQLVETHGATYASLYVVTRTAQPGTGQLQVTLRVAGADTLLLVIIPAGSAAGVFSNTTGTVAIGAGAKVNLSLVNSAVGASATIVGATLQATAT